MKREAELAVIRRAFAKQVMAAVQLDDPRLERAFASVRREDYLGPGPWVIPRWRSGYVPTPGDDPVYLYVDNVVQIVGERHINNGQPSGHALWIASLDIREGDRVVHIGAGTGYYSAMLAHMTGPRGAVTAIEIEPALAERARANLAHLANVTVIVGDGVTVPFDTADAIYVNAGATRPADAWLDRLAEGGRLVLPLTTDKGFLNRDPSAPIEKSGAMFRIERRGAEYLAHWISPVAIFPCASARDAASEAALAAAFAAGGWKDVMHLRREDGASGQCWLRAPGWSLTCD
jgi:protein-L-isoaspartate(D-aspartate) O-methyltransferase